MNIFSLSRKKRTKENISNIDYFFSSQINEEFLEFLKNCDYIINVLPSTLETRGLLSNKKLSNCKHKPVFINIGRGDIIDEESFYFEYLYEK